MNCETLTLRISAGFCKNAELCNVLWCSSALHRSYNNITSRLVCILELFLFKHCRKRAFAAVCYWHSWQLTGMGFKSHLPSFEINGSCWLIQALGPSLLIYNSSYSGRSSVNWSGAALFPPAREILGARDVVKHYNLLVSTCGRDTERCCRSKVELENCHWFFNHLSGKLLVALSIQHCVNPSFTEASLECSYAKFKVHIFFSNWVYN